MQISDEIIKVLDYLCDKIGITIDWTSSNVFPYVKQLCEKFVKWEIGTSITWIGIALIATIIVFIFSKGEDDFESGLFWFVVCIAIIIIGKQIFDIVKCHTFPEKAIYDYLKFYLDFHK